MRRFERESRAWGWGEGRGFVFLKGDMMRIMMRQKGKRSMLMHGH